MELSQVRDHSALWATSSSLGSGHPSLPLPLCVHIQCTSCLSVTWITYLISACPLLLCDFLKV